MGKTMFYFPHNLRSTVLLIKLRWVSDDRWRLGTCGLKMTASDSDCSIDWLASDDDDDSSSSSSGGGGGCRGDGASEADSAGRVTPEPEPEPSGEPPGAPPRRWTAAGPPRGHVTEGSGHDSESWGRRAPQAAPECHTAQKRPCCQGPELRARQGAEADKLLHHKCRQLQCYTLPLTSILNGLQSGRYRERLTSFQESVAMDRIRRILGVLQNPCMGERYINIVLKLEVMLKTWFPNVKPFEQQVEDQDSTPSKRQKISPAGMAPSVSASASVPGSLCAQPSDSKAQPGSEGAGPGVHSATNLKWLHTSPICSPAEETRGRLPWQRAAAGRRAVTQDNAVSSSTGPDARGDPPPGPKPLPPPPLSQPPSGKISAPCLERLLKSTESIVTRRGGGGAVESGWS
ncbi:circadian-associated transcriptional repressor-like isoform X1 [Conger conger]|uniref:circadian-associated transcriptional repressor-like isoform X1 n=2 Tax=Conger conger TaxID=82655 RepID=UPI002A5ABF59|nr:circadian-associated transcriptional repressor-like isoform X1 [Conger conger]